MGYHLLYSDCEDNIIYFNISHALAGGKGMTPWIMSCVYEYIVQKYGVCPDAPAVRKSGSELLEGETAIPTIEMTKESKDYPVEKFKGSLRLVKEYLNSFFNPFVSSNEFYQLEFNQEDILKIAKATDNSVLTLFQMQIEFLVNPRTIHRLNWEYLIHT